MAKEKNRVLVVDDDAGIRDILKDFLSRKGYSVDTASDGLKAQEALNREQGAYELVITDNQMPRLLGVELVRWIKRIYPRTKVIFMTVDAAEGVMATAMAAGADEVLRKPFNIDLLTRLVDKVAAESARC